MKRYRKGAPTEEANMEKKDKPLRDWTLGEVYDFCHGDDAFCTAGNECCPFFRTICNKRAFDWNLGKRLTEVELERCRVCGAKWVSLDCDGGSYIDLWAKKPEIVKTLDDRITYAIGPNNPSIYLGKLRKELFTSVCPGDCICAEEAGGGGD